MNYNPKNLIERTGLNLDQKSIDLVKRENKFQLLSSLDIHAVAHLLTNPESYFLEVFPT